LTRTGEMHSVDPFSQAAGGSYGTHFTRCHWFPMVVGCCSRWE